MQSPISKPSGSLCGVRHYKIAVRELEFLSVVAGRLLKDLAWGTSVVAEGDHISEL